MGKYEKAVACKYPGKLTFFANDMPKFEQKDAFATQRRVWVMPMRAQFLGEDDVVQRNALIREGQSARIFIRDDSVNIQDLIAKTHIHAYMKWVVSGAVDYYATGLMKSIPKVVSNATLNEGRDILKELEIFAKEAFEDADAGSFIPVDEMKEVYLLSEGFDTDIDETKRDEIRKALNRCLLGERDPKTSYQVRAVTRDKLPNVVHGRREYAGRGGKERVAGFSGLQWAPGRIGKFVNMVRSEYVNADQIEPISEEEPAAAAPEEAQQAPAAAQGGSRDFFNRA